MYILTMNLTCGVASLLGTFIHQIVFRHGEWHLQATKIMKTHLLILALLAVGVSRFLDAVQALQKSSMFLVSYTLGLLASMIVYRTMFHELCRYRGPFMARVSKLWHTVQCSDSKNYLFLDKIRKQYGDFVRTGMGINCPVSNNS